jgi:single stranded DNA-binding protein
MLQVTAVGYLAADPEIKSVGDNEVANFTVLCNKKIKGDEHVSTLRCAVWGPRSKVVADFLAKGSQVTVTGQAYIETYESKTGEARAQLNVAVNEFSLPPKPKVETDVIPF